MGKTGENSWLNAVKRAFRSPVKDNEKRTSRRGEEREQDDEEKKRGKRRWILWKPSLHETTIQHTEAKNKTSPISTSSTSNGATLLKTPLSANAESEQRRGIAVAMAMTAAAEAAVATAQAEIIRLTRPNSISVEQRQAAVVIQTIFRGYLARKAMRALKGVVMLQSLIRGYNVRKRAKMTLQCMQSLVRVQTRVCDQRRRLSCEGSRSSMFVEPDNGGEYHILNSKPITRNVSSTADDSEENSYTHEEIQALIQKAKDFSLKHGNTLARALTQQIWSVDDEGLELENAKRFGTTMVKQCNRNDKYLCGKDTIKTVEIDTDGPYSNRASNIDKLQDHQYHQDHQEKPCSYLIPSPLHRKHDDFSLHSPNMSSSPNIKSKVHSVSPLYQRLERNYQTAETPTLRSNCFHRMSVSRNSVPASQPNYMATTASAKARVRSQSASRHRPLTPEREKTGSVKKRLYFPVPDQCNDIGINCHISDHYSMNTQSYKNIHMVPFCVEQRSNISSCCTDSLADDISSSATCDTRRWLR
ncbi:unnamed protein product [Fraxinus pennsylvanica]|uniref:DUF4005 domain-containing protein n=1 Tax=Fraxinus pennsylvanica TaxID=56036 RepID=A0AAD1Z6P4_9LAMI|nr:unnamed protein product [Fraxinus pennsylvanica]